MGKTISAGRRVRDVPDTNRVIVLTNGPKLPHIYDRGRRC